MATTAPGFSPGVLVANRAGVTLWTDGELVSRGLRVLAEEGFIASLMFEAIKGVGKGCLGRADAGADQPPRCGRLHRQDLGSDEAGRSDDGRLETDPGRFRTVAAAVAAAGLIKDIGAEG